MTLDLGEAKRPKHMSGDSPPKVAFATDPPGTTEASSPASLRNSRASAASAGSSTAEHDPRRDHSFGREATAGQLSNFVLNTRNSRSSSRGRNSAAIVAKKIIHHNEHEGHSHVPLLRHVLHAKHGLAEDGHHHHHHWHLPHWHHAHHHKAEEKSPGARASESTSTTSQVTKTPKGRRRSSLAGRLSSVIKLAQWRDNAAARSTANLDTTKERAPELTKVSHWQHARFKISSSFRCAAPKRSKQFCGPPWQLP